MMSKRYSGGPKEENYEHVLMCLICRSLFDDYDHQPKFLPCHHTFCKDCLREYVKQAGDEIECPSCRKIATIPTAGVVALQTNFYVKYIQSLVYGSSGPEGNHALECDIHPKAKLLYYCKDCSRSICNTCCDSGQGQECAAHKKVPLTTMTEEYHQKLDTAFSKANSVIEHKKVELEAMMKAFSEEKDQAMRKIDSSFEQHIHTLTRRSTLLKNKVIAIYNEHIEKLEADLEEISTAMTCIVSLKEYHENMIGKGYFIDIHKGIAEMDEVFSNVKSRIMPKENHIIFEEKHGVEQYRGAAKDVGRVRNSRPSVPRSEPEGNDAQTQFSPVNQATDTEFVSPSGLDSAAAFSNGDEAVGAVGGPTPAVDFPSLGAGIPEDCSVKLKPKPGNNTTSQIPQTETKTSISHCDTGAGGAHSHSAQLNAHGHSLLENNKLDINSNTPITVPGVVRPKTLTGRSSPCTMATSHHKDTNHNGIIKRPVESKHIVKPQNGRSKATTLNSLHRSDPGPSMYSLSTLKIPEPELPKVFDRDIENLKQTDKMYHHLVYTSYDEEELLKELQSGKAHLDPSRAIPESPGSAPLPPDPKQPQHQRSMEDSDSWMTVSSESTLSCDSDDLTINDEISRL